MVTRAACTLPARESSPGHHQHPEPFEPWHFDLKYWCFFPCSPRSVDSCMIVFGGRVERSAALNALVGVREP